MSNVSSIRRYLALLALSLAFVRPGIAAPLEIDRIVAVINNAVITEFELKGRVDQTLRQLDGRNTPPPPRRRPRPA